VEATNLRVGGLHCKSYWAAYLRARPLTHVRCDKVQRFVKAVAQAMPHDVGVGSQKKATLVGLGVGSNGRTTAPLIATIDQPTCLITIVAVALHNTQLPSKGRKACLAHAKTERAGKETRVEQSQPWQLPHVTAPSFSSLTATWEGLDATRCLQIFVSPKLPWTARDFLRVTDCFETSSWCSRFFLWGT
jgi:hypothetical protein